MKIKLNETTPIQINWLVAEALNPGDGQRILANEIDFIQYHEDWAQGGPIIDRCGIATARVKAIKSWHWTAGFSLPSKNPSYGNTPLIAAMRCFVASRLGDEVEVPDELC